MDGSRTILPRPQHRDAPFLTTRTQGRQNGQRSSIGFRKVTGGYKVYSALTRKMRRSIYQPRNHLRALRRSKSAHAQVKAGLAHAATHMLCRASCTHLPNAASFLKGPSSTSHAEEAQPVSSGHLRNRSRRTRLSKSVAQAGMLASTLSRLI